jgi:hypothetical protein
MLENKYFDDAFILHEEIDNDLFKEMMSNIIKNGLNCTNEIIEKLKEANEIDKNRAVEENERKLLDIS